MDKKNTPAKPDLNPVKPGDSFTQAVIEKARKRQTLKDFLFMIAMGFKNILSGFLKPNTVQHLPENQQKRKDR